MEVASRARGSRRVHMGEGFFTGYRRNIIEPDELLVWLSVPRTTRDQYFIAYKQAKRRDDDIAIVNMALNIQFQTGKDVVANAHVAFGGMAPTVVLAPKSCATLVGKRWTRRLVEQMNDHLMAELPLAPGAPGGMIVYRRALTLSLFFKAFLEIGQSLEGYVLNRKAIPERERSGANTFHTMEPKSCQIYQRIPGANERGSALGQPQVHASAFKQATGEAVYIDDMPRFNNELYMAYVLSTKAHARLVSIDATEALKLDGVHAFFSARDLSEHENAIGPVFHDEELFISERVTSQGQTLGVIVAENQELAQRAARLVKVEYEELSPVIVSIEDAIRLGSFYDGCPKIIETGDVQAALATEGATIVQGECRIGGQEHFYLETHAALAVPRDSDELELYSSTQHPTEIQKLAAHVLGISASRVTSKVKRMGGGFGGKESRGMLVALPVALAAYRLGRPVRCMLDRDEDMLMSGTRHPFLFKYKAAAGPDGKLLACDIEIYSNAGYSADLSGSVRYIANIIFFLDKTDKFTFTFIFCRSSNALCSTAAMPTRCQIYVFAVGFVARTYHRILLSVVLADRKACSLASTLSAMWRTSYVCPKTK